MNKTRKVGLAKRRRRMVKLHALEKHPATPQKGPRSEKAHAAPIPTLALTPLPRR